MAEVSIDVDERLTAFARELAESGEDFAVPVAAGEFVEIMEADHPGDLVRWLSDHARAIIAKRLQAVLASDRQRAIHRAEAKAFARAAETAADAPSVFAATFVINEDNMRRPLAKMTGSDCHFAAQSYEAKGKRLLLMGAFLRAVGDRAGSRRVEEVMDEHRCERLLNSITGTAPEEEPAESEPAHD